MIEISKLALGTAQFGLAYGVANQRGQVTLEEATAILDYAWEAGVRTLDTAIAYGTSETHLGQIGINPWQTVSKLPSLPDNIDDIQTWVKQVVSGSLERLHLDCLYGLLLHHPQDLLGNQGQILYAALKTLQQQGWVSKIGISVYSPVELEALCPDFDFELIQAPFNVLDRRLVHSGWLARLKKQGIEVHVRSVFLQGLLLMHSHNRPIQFNRWHQIWERWQQWLGQTHLQPLEACLGFALHYPGIDRVLVGVDSLSQLQEILAVAAKPPQASLPSDFYCDDLDLINPAQWHLT